MEGKRERKNATSRRRRRFATAYIPAASRYLLLSRPSKRPPRPHGGLLARTYLQASRRAYQGFQWPRDASEPLAPVHAFGGLLFHRMVLSKMGNVRRFSRRQGRIPNLK